MNQEENDPFYDPYEEEYNRKSKLSTIKSIGVVNLKNSNTLFIRKKTMTTSSKK